jgi:two-component system, cell cycle sensor histidine kinase and response regulator CckA
VESEGIGESGTSAAKSSLRVEQAAKTSEAEPLEHAVRESDLKYESLISAIDGIVWEANPRNHSFSFVGKPAEKLLGYPASEWLGDFSFWADRIHPDDQAWVLASRARAIAESRSHELVYRMIAADGKSKWLRDIVTVIVENGEAVKLCGLIVCVADYKEAEQVLRTSEERLQALVSSLPIILFALDREGVFTLSEGKGLEMLGRRRGDRVGYSLFDLYPDHPEIIGAFKRSLQGETLATTAQVGDLVFEAWCAPCRDENGRISGVIGVATDITENKRDEAIRRSLEQQLLQAQKMESVGRLAGGIAHDFNNLLTAIIGYGQLILGELGPDHPVASDTQEILAAGYRAASLTSQLLAFSREALVHKSVDLNETIANITKMLGRVIGEDVELRFSPDPDMPLVWADAGQIEQVLMNLAINARDAMPDGGTLIIETRHAYLDSLDCCRHPWTRPGMYARISVTDNGVGMDPSTKERIFEPFFTTKEPGKGTGLGLAVVYSIVEQHQGLVRVHSQSGIGTTFSIFIPIKDVTSEEETKPDEAPVRGGSETILLAEDEKAVRELARNALGSLGYELLVANDGEEALRIYETNRQQISLAVFDWVMPRMGGLEAYRRIRASGSDVPVMFVTGYGEEVGRTEGLEDEELTLLRKPYGVAELGRKVREVLDQTAVKCSTPQDQE